MKKLKCQKGQGLVEYLIIVAMMGVATIGVVRMLNHTINAQFTDVVYALKGQRKRSEKESVNSSIYKKKDMSSFINGAASKGK